MADTTASSDTGDDPVVGPLRNSTTGTPRWVKVFGLIALIVVVLFVILLLAGGHDPGRHRHVGGLRGSMPAASARDYGVHLL